MSSENVNQENATLSEETNSTGADTRHQEAKDLLSGYLNRQMRVFLTDGRVIIGTFMCTDRDSNLVVGNCDEYLSKDDLDDAKVGDSKYVPRRPRTVGQVIVPGHHIKGLSIAKGPPNKTFLIEPTTTSASASPESSLANSPVSNEQINSFNV